MKKMKILMLEDNRFDADLIKEELISHKFDFTSEVVQTEKDFINAIHDFKPDIILSDYSLPQFTGFEALEIAKKLIPDIPFIIITGSLSEEMAADSIKRGAWDYVLKENLV
ncbi:MAG: response regulator, partial [Candidatus Celaenobacter antarcticus]|nr:response regulator [Candidatus Celaenobacter antarcticus]